MGQLALGCGPLHFKHTWAIGQLAPALHGAYRFQLKQMGLPSNRSPVAFATALDVSAWATSALEPGETPITVASVLDGKALLGLSISLLPLLLRQTTDGCTTSTIAQ